MLTNVFLTSIEDINYFYIRKHINIMCTVIFYHIYDLCIQDSNKLYFNNITGDSKTYLYLLVI